MNNQVTENGLTADEMKTVLDRASRLYARGVAGITDAEFDRLKAAWEKATGETYFWSDVETDGDVKHSRPMLSLEKAKTVADALKFLKYTDAEVLIMPKVDGLAMASTYDAAVHSMALTRGKRVGGETWGNVVTGNARQILPGSIPHLGPLEVRGEVYLPEERFATANLHRSAEGKEPFENVRNAAAGILRNEDSNCLHLLRFVAYNAFNPEVPAYEDTRFKTFSELLEFTKSQGFETVPYETLKLSELTLEKLHEFADNQAFPYQTDGVVVILNDMNLQRSLGSNRSHPLYAVGFKFEDETAETTLIGIEWTATRTGRVMPTYVFQEVRLEGTTVVRATGHNLANLVKIGALPGDKVEVYKANMIIPQVKRVTQKAPKRPCGQSLPGPYDLETYVPRYCPSCGHPTTRNDVDLLCENSACSAKLVLQIVNAANRKNWDIDVLGESVAEALVTQAGVKSLADLFTLDQGIAEMKLGEKGITFGESRAETLLTQIEKAKSKPWAVTLHALGCPGLGEPECREIAKRYSLKDLLLANAHEDAPEAMVAELVKIKGMGKKTAETLVDWLTHRDNKWLYDLQTAGLKTDREEGPELASNKLDGKVFVITGTHSVPRPVLEKLVTDNGGTLSGSVSKKTDYLVAGEAAGSKLEKAEAVNAKAKTDADKVTIIDEKGLRELLS